MSGFVSRLLAGPGAVDPAADPAGLARCGKTTRARLEELGARNRGGRRAALYVVRDFVSEPACERLIRLIDSEVAPSTLFNDGGGAGLRTSSTHYFSNTNPVATALAQRIDSLLGIAPAHAEPMQGQRYLPGEQYRYHCDFFHIERTHWERERQRGGQRTWTAMVYLNAVEGGGATEFPRLDLRFQPEPGTLVVWDNMDTRGRPNRATIHAGLPVLAGRKYVVTRWYRLDQWTQRVR